MERGAATNPSMLDDLREFFRGRPEVAAACLFGSAATGQAGPLSDLDIGVLLAEPGRAQLSAGLAPSRPGTFALPKCGPGSYNI